MYEIADFKWKICYSYWEKHGWALIRARALNRDNTVYSLEVFQSEICVHTYSLRDQNISSEYIFALALSLKLSFQLYFYDRDESLSKYSQYFCPVGRLETTKSRDTTNPRHCDDVVFRRYERKVVNDCNFLYTKYPCVYCNWISCFWPWPSRPGLAFLCFCASGTPWTGNLTPEIWKAWD